MTFIGIDGVVHHVVVDGTGPLCVLSSGLGMCWFDWDPVAALLSPHRTVVRFDRPGLGLSGHTRAWPTLAGEARRIAAVLDVLRLDGPATVVGHSLAGFHAEAFARLFPSRTAGLVLVDSSVEEDPRPRGARAVRLAATRACGTVASVTGLPRALGPLLRRAAVRAGRVGGGEPASYDLVRRAYSTSRWVHAALSENATYTDEAVELAALRGDFRLPAGLPVTVLAADDPRRSAHGREQWLARQRALAATLGGTFRASAPAGHLLMLDRPEDVADAVLATPAHPPVASQETQPPVARERPGQ
ncbi:alpha/beta hydrolase [Streptomyces sp. Li-HN-5-11]|uniref:alpha/beta fold hydrolase n=1 Tax=Streptomyces sp. Li-HN-5-11 TaxID=3075432 RepID=UPI0028B26609|nr:alpha/beta hydrolase [Streptomyces sp. Li-HN-5-11]WNM34684.1 alpha/beta hydrolase [Streptomyces sp. Li-HN-5-11]